MKDWPRLIKVVPIGGYRLRLTYSSGLTGDVDFSETVARGGIFTFMRNTERFKTVKIAYNGSALLWLDDDGDEIDFCADTQRLAIEASQTHTFAAQ